MPAVRRPDPLDRILDLTRRLAEEFDTVPIPMVSRAVKDAVAAARLFGNDLGEALGTIERIAREDLAAVRAARDEQAHTALAG